MEINFNCPQCGQELTADDTMLGVEIECPACKETIMIEGEAAEAAAEGEVEYAVAEEEPAATRAPISIGASHATADMILKPKAKRLEVAAKEDVAVLSRTILYSANGKDIGKFDETVAKTLAEIGRPHIVSINTVNPGEGDFGVLIIYEKQN